MSVSEGERPSRRSWVLWAVAGLGIVTSLLLARHLHVRERELFRSEFEQRARERAVAIEHTLRDNLTHVESIVALFNASERVERDEFHVFARSILLSDRRHALRAIGFNPVVPGNRRLEHEQQVRSEGLVDYRITELDSSGGLVPAAPRGSYVPVSFLEPLAGNDAALGFDVASESVRRDALTRARDRGRAAVTGRLRLVQQEGAKPGAVIFAPVYAGNRTPEGVEERRRKLRGYAAGVLLIDEVVERALAGLRPIDIHIRIEDRLAPPAAELLYSDSSGDGPEPRQVAARASYEFPFAGRRWRIVETPSTAYRASRTTWGPVGIGVAGLLLTGLIVGYLQWQTSTNQRLRLAVRERDRAEDRQAGLGRALDEAHDEIYVFDAATLKFLHVNRGARANLGYGMDELRAMTPLDLKTEMNHESFARLIQPLRDDTRDKVRFVTVHRRKDGSAYDVEVHLQLAEFDSRAAFIAVILDITERKELEKRLRESQRLEALGIMAGGIAHDFNNLLTSIVGYTELALAELPADGPVRERLVEVLKASDRAREVVSRILAFSRRSTIESRTFDLRDPVRDALQLIRVSLPPNIEIRAELDGPCPVDGDPNQIQQVLMNLFTNAAHAMRNEGGSLEVRLRHVAIAPGRDPAADGLESGEYAQISVRDSGQGISPEILGQIFDPFFTTKGPGEGTGMGLAVAHGIVLAHNGVLTARSKPGEGSTFEILLPRSAAEITEGTEFAETVPRGHESILVVDDEPGIADLLREVLERQGYRVLAKSDSRSALEAFRAAPDSFDLVITDFAMPDMTGGELAFELTRIAPELPVILVSGHGDLLERHGTENTGIRLSLTKPVTFRELASAVRRVLDEV